MKVAMLKFASTNKNTSPLYTGMAGEMAFVSQGHVKTKNKVVEPTSKAAAVETGMYFVGLNLLPVLLGILWLTHHCAEPSREPGGRGQPPARAAGGEGEPGRLTSSTGNPTPAARPLG